MSKFAPIHQESVTYKNRNDFDKDLSVAYPMCMSRSAVMTEMRVVGEHLVAEWNHLKHEGKIYVLDELSNEKLGAYHKAAMHDTLAGKKNRTAGMSKAVIRLAGAHKPLIKEGEDLVKPQAVPATDGKAQELSEGETRRFVAWSKDPAKAVGFVGGDEEAVRKAAAAHFKASAFGVDVLDAALKTQLKQNGVPENLWVASKDDVVLSEGKVGDVVYGAWRVGHQVQSRREKVSGKITGAARGPASGTKWVTVDDGAKTHTLPAAELTPAKGYGWPDDDGKQSMVESKFYLATKDGSRITTNPKVFYSKAEAEQHKDRHSNLPILDGAVVMQESMAADDELLAVLSEAKNPKSLSHADLVSILKDSDIPVKAIESAYAGCDADICHYFAVVESGDLFGVVGIRIMSMDGDISVLSFDTEASDVSEDKEAAMASMVKAASKPLSEARAKKVGGVVKVKTSTGEASFNVADGSMELNNSGYKQKLSKEQVQAAWAGKKVIPMSDDEAKEIEADYDDPKEAKERIQRGWATYKASHGLWDFGDEMHEIPEKEVFSLSEAVVVRADTELLEAIDLLESSTSFQKQFLKLIFREPAGLTADQLSDYRRKSLEKQLQSFDDIGLKREGEHRIHAGGRELTNSSLGFTARIVDNRENQLVRLVWFDKDQHQSMQKAEEYLIKQAEAEGFAAERLNDVVIVAKNAAALKKAVKNEIRTKEILEMAGSKGLFKVPPFPANLVSFVRFASSGYPLNIKIADAALASAVLSFDIETGVPSLTFSGEEEAAAGFSHLKAMGFKPKAVKNYTGKSTIVDVYA